MKKLVFASVMALASLSLVFAPALRAQDPITIKDPAEFNAYQMATTQTDPTAKAAAWRAFCKLIPRAWSRTQFSTCWWIPTRAWTMPTRL